MTLPSSQGAIQAPEWISQVRLRAMVRVLREACSGQKHCGATPQVVWQLWCYLAEIFGTTISFWMWHRLGVLKLAIYFFVMSGRILCGFGSGNWDFRKVNGLIIFRWADIARDVFWWVARSASAGSWFLRIQGSNQHVKTAVTSRIYFPVETFTITWAENRDITLDSMVDPHIPHNFHGNFMGESPDFQRLWERPPRVFCAMARKLSCAHDRGPGCQGKPE